MIHFSKDALQVKLKRGEPKIGGPWRQAVESQPIAEAGHIVCKIGIPVGHRRGSRSRGALRRPECHLWLKKPVCEAALNSRAALKIATN